MRKIYLVWSIAVFGIIGTVYGGYALIYSFSHDNKLSVLGLVLFIFGVLTLGLFLVLYILTLLAKKKKKNEPVPPVEEKPVEEKPAQEEKEEPSKEEPEPIPQTSPAPQIEPEEPEPEERAPRPQRNYGSSSSYYASTVYVKQVGYGPLLRIEGPRIIDMRTNTYYRIENNRVMQEGYGPVFEIRGNQIRDAFGGYLYEYNGSNINKVYGGYYASVSGNYITLYDLSTKYEVTDSLTRNQILAVAALLFGKY